MGPGKHFVHYFAQSQRLINFVAIVEQDSWTRESWTEQTDVAEALAAFEGWQPQVLSILGAVDETFIWGLFERSPMKRWSIGRVTLLGDACHAMLPSGRRVRRRLSRTARHSRRALLKRMVGRFLKRSVSTSL